MSTKRIGGLGGRKADRPLAWFAATVLLAAVVFPSCGKKDDDVVIVFSRGSLCLAPLQIAAINGYYEEEFGAVGVSYRFEEVDPGTAFEVVGAGKANASATLSASTIPSIDNGLAIAFTAGLHTGCTKYLVRADSPIKSIADLKGAKIGVLSMGDSATVNIKRILAEQGFKVSGEAADIEIVIYGANDMPLALQNGAIDLASMHDPTAYIAQEEFGFRVLIDTLTDEKFSHEYCCQSYVSTKLARENPRAAAAYTRAIMKASAFVKANPEITARLQVEGHYVLGDASTNAQVLKLLNYEPSVRLAQATIFNIAVEMKGIGELKAEDATQFASEHFATFDDVPESYVWNADGTFSEVW